MTKSNYFWLLATVFLITGPAEAQQTKKIPLIGVLVSGLKEASIPPLDGLRQGLLDLGYTDEKNIAIEYRFSGGKPARLPDLAAELVRLKVDVIVAVPGTAAILAAKNATSTIPIVFPTSGDPVALGIVASLARPGGNVTGLANRTPEFHGKRIELLKEVVPRTKRVAILGPEADPAATHGFKEMQSIAAAMDLQLNHIEVRSPGDFEAAFAKISGTVRATALFLQSAPLLNNHAGRIADLAAKGRLPAIAEPRELAEAGILMSYGSDRFDQGRRAAVFVDKILKGAKPADLPVEQPKKFELVINLKTAKQIGLTIPPNMLVRADRVIR